MTTERKIKVCRALLSALAAVPAEFLLDEETLRADASRMVIPRPSTSEIDEALLYLDRQRRVAGIVGESGTLQWQITDGGRLWLARNP